MNKLLLIISIAGLLLSCKKTKLSVTYHEVAGTWEYEQYIGYPFMQTALAPGNGKIIVLGADGSFEKRQHDTLLFKGTYKLREKKDCHPRESNTAFYTSQSTDDVYNYIEVDEQGRLVLSIPNCFADGGLTYYRKIE